MSEERGGFERKAFYDPAEAAGLLGLTLEEVLGQIERGALYAVRLPTRELRIPLAVIMRRLHPEATRPRRVDLGERREESDTSFETFWNELVREVEAEGPAAVAPFEQLREAFRRAGEEAIRRSFVDWRAERWQLAQLNELIDRIEREGFTAVPRAEIDAIFTRARAHGGAAVRGEVEHYSGWAPCFHAGGVTPDQARKRERAWLDQVTGELGAADGAELIETLLVELTQQAEVRCASDQWVGVHTEGAVRLDGRPHDEWPRFSTYIQGDNVTLALAETWRVWRERARRSMR